MSGKNIRFNFNRLKLSVIKEIALLAYKVKRENVISFLAYKYYICAEPLK